MPFFAPDPVNGDTQLSARPVMISLYSLGPRVVAARRPRFAIPDKMREKTLASESSDSELRLLRLRVKQLESENQMLRCRQEVLDQRHPSDAIDGLSVLLGLEDGVVIFDAEWRFRLCNRNAELLLRATRRHVKRQESMG